MAFREETLVEVAGVRASNDYMLSITDIIESAFSGPDDEGFTADMIGSMAPPFAPVLLPVGGYLNITLALAAFCWFGVAPTPILF